jgi:hypothetical protein
MKTKYRTNRSNYPDYIHPVQVAKETEKSVWPVGGRNAREAKISDYVQYHDTWEEAHKWLVKRANKRVNSAIIRLAGEEGERDKILGLEA